MSMSMVRESSLALCIILMLILLVLTGDYLEGNARKKLKGAGKDQPEKAKAAAKRTTVVCDFPLMTQRENMRKLTS